MKRYASNKCYYLFTISCTLLTAKVSCSCRSIPISASFHFWENLWRFSYAVWRCWVVVCSALLYSTVTYSGVQCTSCSTIIVLLYAFIAIMIVCWKHGVDAYVSLTFYHTQQWICLLHPERVVKHANLSLVWLVRWQMSCAQPTNYVDIFLLLNVSLCADTSVCKYSY